MNFKYLRIFEVNLKWIKLWIPPALIWGLMIVLRGPLGRFSCLIPHSCQVNDVNTFDQFSFHFQNMQGFFRTDWPSDFMEGLTVLLAFGTFYFLKRAKGNELICIILWNGACDNIVRLIVQRPRPYVFLNPETLGGLTSSYTSFYSGHSCFVSSLALGAFFVLKQDKTPPAILNLTLIWAILVMAITAIMRLYSFHHFPSDILTGLFAGGLTAFIVCQKLFETK